MAKRFLWAAIIFYALGFIAVCIAFNFLFESAAEGTAPGLIAAACILSGSFFLYHYFTNKYNS